MRMFTFVLGILLGSTVWYAEVFAQHSHISLAPRLGDLDVDVAFPKCGVSVRFSGKPRLLTQAELDKEGSRFGKEFKWEIDQLFFMGNGLNESAACACRNSPFTDSEVAAGEEAIRGLQGQVIRTITNDLLRRAWEADYPTQVFNVNVPLARVRGIVSFSTVNKYCIAMVQVAHAGIVPPRGEAFLRTFQVIPNAAPRSAEVQRPPGAQPSASSRLSELQELLDRGQITKEEFDKKRKAILDEL
jgi:hypothetical protein